MDSDSSGYMIVTVLLIAALVVVTVMMLRYRRLITGMHKAKAESTEDVTEERLISMVEKAENAGSIGENHGELIQKAIGFYDLKAEDVMTPRPEIKAIDAGRTNEELAAVFRETGYSRLPVYEEELDHIVGVINQKDFHNHMQGTGRAMSDYIVPAIFVSRTIGVSELLKKMQDMKIQMAIVIDEYGGTEGLVTMEDIVEELVGEIFDEQDSVISKDVLPLQNGSFRVKCSAGINRVFEYFGIEKTPDVTTVNGWVVMNLDKMPEKDDTFEAVVDGRRLKVRITKADGKKAVEINLKVEEA